MVELQCVGISKKRWNSFSREKQRQVAGQSDMHVRSHVEKIDAGAQNDQSICLKSTAFQPVPVCTVYVFALEPMRSYQGSYTNAPNENSTN